MDWKQIIGGIIIGAIIGIAGGFFVLGQRTAKLETQIEHLKSQIDRQKETSGSGVEMVTLPQTQSTGFRSPDKRYEAVKVGVGAEIHYQVKEIETDRIVLTTHAEYSTPNDVKAGTFSPDSKKFAAAYHYGHAGSYTWIGIWDIKTGSLQRTERKPGWTTDIYSIFNKESM